MKKLSLREIEQMANAANFGSYEGKAGNKREGLASFNGMLPSGVNFTTDRIHSITIDNTSGVDVQVALFTAYARITDQGTVKKAVDGAVAADVLGSGLPTSIANIQEFVKLNPSKVTGFKVRSTAESQLAEIMQIKYQSPFRSLQDELIDLSSYASESNQNQKLLTVPRSFQLDNQTEIFINIPAGVKTTFTFYFGDVLNTAAALESK